MKNTIQETYGNNIPSKKIKRIIIPLFTQENKQATPGLKYFFPENPEIDRNNITGIEAHVRSSVVIGIGDISNSLIDIVDQFTASDIYICLYNENNEEIFYNLPLRSLFTITPFNTTNTLTKRIKPFLCKLKTRSCYAYIPANSPQTYPDNLYISLTFFYN
jgi:hypothetical protein